MKAEMRVAADVAAIGMSAIKDMAMRAASVPDALSLSWGLPSFQTPAPIRRAVAAALESDPDIGKYTLPNGLAELRALAAQDFAARGGASIDPDTQVVITAGNMEGIQTLLRTILEPGDEVIVTDPCFASHILQIGLCHGRCVYLPLDEKSGWQLDPDLLEGLISARTKAILLVTPHNPTGVVFSHQSLEALGRIAQRHGLLVILDDPYSRFVYGDNAGDGDPAFLASFEGGLAYLFTFSKTYAMSGWRVGYMILPPGLAPHVLKVHDAALICAPRISQVAAIAALKDPSLPPREFRAQLDARRKLILERIQRVPQLFECVPPQGAYYVFPKIIGPQTDSRAFSIALLNQTGVAVTPGAAFGPSGEGHVRMAYCVDEQTINGAFDRIEDFLSRTRQRGTEQARVVTGT